MAYDVPFNPYLIGNKPSAGVGAAMQGGGPPAPQWTPDYSGDWYGGVGRLGGAAGLTGRASFTQNPSPSDFYSGYGTMGLMNQALAPIDTAYQLQRTGLQQGWGLTQQGLALDRQAAQQRYGTELAKQNLQRGDISARRNRLGQEPGFINREYGLDVQAAELGKKQVGAQWETGLRELYSDATARGALTTGGSRAKRGDLWKQMAFGMEQGDIALGRAGLAKDISFADLAQAKSRLENEAANLGVDAGALKQSLDMALAKIGLQEKTSATQLMVDLGSADIDRAQKAAQTVQGLWQMIQQNPELAQSVGKGLVSQGVTPVPGVPGTGGRRNIVR